MVSRCYRGKTRCTEFTRYSTVVKMLKQQLSAPRSYPLSAKSVCMYICILNGVYNGVWEIRITLSCDCPCGDPIKIRIASRTTTRNREKWSSRIFFSYLPSFFFCFFFFYEIQYNSRFLMHCVLDIYCFPGNDPGGYF